MIRDKKFITLIVMLAFASFGQLQAQELKAGTKRAFLVACGDQHLDERLNLPKAVEDMDKFQQALLRTGFKPENITYLQSKDGVKPKSLPFRSVILGELELMIKSLNPGDTLVIALNGHGIHPKNAKTSYFVPLDGKIGNEKTLVSMEGEDSIFGMARDAQKKNARVLLIVGACRNDFKDNIQALNQMDLEDPDVPPEGVAAIYSCGVGQKTYFDEKGGSYFYEHLSKAWVGEYHPSDENITLEMVFKSISDKTFADVRSKYAEAQKPEMRRQYKGEWLINKNDLEIRSILDVYLPLAFKRQNYKARQVLENINSQQMNRIRLFASKNSPEALLLQGICLFEGVHLVKDYEEAFRAFKKSAESGHPVGMLFCGLCYRDGIGVSRNNEEAYKWIMKSAEIGETSGMNAAGDCFMHGIGVTKDKNKAFDWYKRSANKGDTLGMVGLGHCYFYGRGIIRDKTEGFKWYLESAKADNSVGMEFVANRLLDCNCCGFYLNSKEENMIGILNNSNQFYKREYAANYGRIMLLKSAYLGNSSAMIGLHSVLDFDNESFSFEGIDIKNDITKLEKIRSKPFEEDKKKQRQIFWLQKSCDLGNTSAMAIMGESLLKSDEKKGINLLEKSAQSQNPLGIRYLAEFFGKIQFGSSSCSSVIEPIGSWIYRDDIYHGQNYIRSQIEIGFKEKIDFKKSFNLFTQAAEYGCIYSLIVLEVFFRDGIGVEKNKTKADEIKDKYESFMNSKYVDIINDGFQWYLASEGGMSRLLFDPYIQKIN